MRYALIQGYASPYHQNTKYDLDAMKDCNEGYRLSFVEGTDPNEILFNLNPVLFSYYQNQYRHLKDVLKYLMYIKVEKLNRFLAEHRMSNNKPVLPSQDGDAFCAGFNALTDDLFILFPVKQHNVAV